MDETTEKEIAAMRAISVAIAAHGKALTRAGWSWLESWTCDQRVRWNAEIEAEEKRKSEPGDSFPK